MMFFALEKKIIEVIKRIDKKKNTQFLVPSKAKNIQIKTK